MIELTSSQRSALRARAHSLHPVASISQNGLSNAVLAEIDRSLRAHELIKVRVYDVERDEREALLAEICNRLDAAPVQHIGNVLVVYRANPEAPATTAKPVKKTASRTKPKTLANPANPRRRLKK
ncbi:MAG: YhbY family RNA-binding protein [Denitratisoma sp.]|nr:YhbY family RNA-binding protein [Denitratisoma sp.]